jgi:ATP-dependent DNA helicase RecG
MRRKGDFDPRKLMEQAVEVMRQSVDEPRGDGKACPKVGAVLLKPDGTVETACRGELRDGDHAEFTLLERKNRGHKLDGSILFATLEPCAPDSRHPPKMGCAERIVLARIKEVWVGIEDPDPTVDRKGIKYLQDSGVTVQMFDRDLQEVIQAENQRFTEQALERAAAAPDAESRQIILSPLEHPLAYCGMDDLSSEALEGYRSVARIEDPVGSPALNSRLAQQGALKLAENQFVPTGYGIVLFGKEPRVPLPQAGLLGTIHYPEGEQEIRNFEGPQILAPGQAIDWLRDKLPNPIDRSQARRREVNAPLFELVREGIVNALVHRDYSITGGKCQLVVTPDKIVVWSPGLPIEPITLEQMQSFTAPMLSRNPPLHHVFARMALAEERGIGLNSLRNTAESAGLPLPRYSWKAPYLLLTVYRSAAGAARDLASEVPDTLSADERRGLAFLATRPSITRKEYAKQMGFDDRKAQRQLKRFIEIGLLRRVGASSAAAYELVDR